MAGLVPPAWDALVAPLLLIAPVATQFTLDADALNSRSATRPGFVVGVIAAAALALALATAAVAMVGTAAFRQVGLDQLARPVFAMPFAVVLVALTAARGKLV